MLKIGSLSATRQERLRTDKKRIPVDYHKNARKSPSKREQQKKVQRGMKICGKCIIICKNDKKLLSSHFE